MSEMSDTVIMRKFLTTNSNAFVDVRSGGYDFKSEEGAPHGWRSIELTLSDGYKYISFEGTVNASPDSQDNNIEEYDRFMKELEAIKQACNAAMDEMQHLYAAAEYGRDDQVQE